MTQDLHATFEIVERFKKSAFIPADEGGDAVGLALCNQAWDLGRKHTGFVSEATDLISQLQDILAVLKQGVSELEVTSFQRNNVWLHGQKLDQALAALNATQEQMQQFAQMAYAYEQQLTIAVAQD